MLFFSGAKYLSLSLAKNNLSLPSPQRRKRKKESKKEKKRKEKKRKEKKRKEKKIDLKDMKDGLD